MRDNARENINGNTVGNAALGVPQICKWFLKIIVGAPF